MIAENVAEIRKKIALACLRCGRAPEDIKLVTVSKTFGYNEICEVTSAGILDIGESYVQELIAKRKAINNEAIRWHFVGHLQRNKVKNIVPWIYLIHSVDSLRLSKEISSWGERCGKTVNILIEVNTSGETAKYGIKPEETLALLKQIEQLPFLKCQGLMTIGPFLPDPEQSRPAFRLLRQLRDECDKEGFFLPYLSMGMSNDFEVAIEEGTTIIRIGTAIFGKRNH